MVQSAVHEYWSAVDDVYGVYLDSVKGFHLVVQQYDRFRREILCGAADISPEQLDKTQLAYGTGDPDNADTRLQHVCTQAEFRARNDEGGKNHTVLANTCLVMLYQYWEDQFRQKIADELGVAKNEVALDIMGDIRHLRRSIVHCGGVAVEDVAKCKIVKCCLPGHLIEITAEQLEDIILHVKRGLLALASDTRLRGSGQPSDRSGRGDAKRSRRQRDEIGMDDCGAA